MQTIGQTTLVPATLYAADGHGRLLPAEKVGLDGVGGVTKAQLPANNRGLEQGPTIAADDTPILNKIILFFLSSSFFPLKFPPPPFSLFSNFKSCENEIRKYSSYLFPKNLHILLFIEFSLNQRWISQSILLITSI